LRFYPVAPVPDPGGMFRRTRDDFRSFAMFHAHSLERGPNDERDEDQIKADNDNHANQCNPNNDEYEHSREGDD